MLLILSSLLWSCEKEPELIGLEVTPPSDQIYANRVDTSSIVAYSFLQDSMRSSLVSYYHLGSIMDPVFGNTTAGFFSQFRLSNVNVSFGNKPGLDSLVLTLAYSTYYGDIKTRQTVHVYEVAETMVRDSAYYSFNEEPVYPNEIAKLSFYPRPADSLMLDSNKVAAYLRINLSDLSPALGNKILNSSKEALADNAVFTKYFKGLAFKADPVSYRGALLYFRLVSSLTRLRLYYHNEEHDSLYFDLKVTDLCARYNHFDHGNYNFASQAFRKQVIYGDTALGKEEVYLQSTGGVHTKIYFPHLKSWPKADKIAVNEAILFLPCGDTASDLEPPVKLYLYRLDANGRTSSMDDESEGSTYFGGTYDSKARGYAFHLNHYVQELLQGKTNDYGMVLMPAGSAAYANRAVLNGINHPTRPMMLRIIYSYIH